MNATTTEDVATFIRDRDAALLSLDEQAIRDFARCWNGIELPTDAKTFWLTVHKARSAAVTLPEDERRKSAAWLEARGCQQFADDIPAARSRAAKQEG